MYHYLNGKITEKTPAAAILDVNGVGYEVRISVNTFSVLLDPPDSSSARATRRMRSGSTVPAGASRASRRARYYVTRRLASARSALRTDRPTASSSSTGRSTTRLDGRSAATSAFRRRTIPMLMTASRAAG